jgi:hypothetical protein
LRIDEAGFELFGYRGDVIFPVDVELNDDSRPAVLALTLDYAVCGDICLPVKAKASLNLPARPPLGGALLEQSPEAVSINEARAKTPLRLDAAARDAKIAIVREANIVQPTWRVRVKPEPLAAGAGDPERGAADLFVEVPEGWYFESKKTDRPDEFLIVEVEAPKPQSGTASAASSATDAAAQIPVTITLARPRQSYEFTLDLGMIAERPSLARAAEPALASAPVGVKQ